MSKFKVTLVLAIMLSIGIIFFCIMNFVFDEKLTDNVQSKQEIKLKNNTVILNGETTKYTQNLSVQSDNVFDDSNNLDKNHSNKEISGKAAKKNAENLELVEYNFLQETIDDQWNSEKELKLKTLLLKDELKNAVLNNIECRSRMCRIDLIHLNSDKAEAFKIEFLRALMKPNPNSKNTIPVSYYLKKIEEIDNSINTIFYLFR